MNLPNTTKAPYINNGYCHNDAEWPLLIFTMGTQMAVGMFCCETLWCWGTRTWYPGLTLVVILALLSSIAAMAHVPSPVRAPRIILHWRTSWLSREILLSGAFTGLVILGWGLRFIDSLSPVTCWMNLLDILTIITGLIAVYSMGKIYLTPTRPTWNSIDTIIAFYSSTFILGWMAAITLLVYTKAPLNPDTVIIMYTGAIIFSVIRILAAIKVIKRVLSLPIYHGQVWSWEKPSIKSSRFIFTIIGGIIIPVVLLVLASFGTILESSLLFCLLLIGLVLVIIGECFDRFLFYIASPAVIFPPMF